MNISTLNKGQYRQRGVALISVLLVFALVSILAGEIISRNYLDIRKTSGFLNSKQAYSYALSGEQFARQILYRDFIESNSVSSERKDALKDNWSLLKKGFDIENGKMTIEIVDLQGRFNVNNLLSVDGQIDQTYAAQFSRLLSVLDVNHDYTQLLADWIDKDHIKMAEGGEDSEYGKRSYLTANNEMVDKSELRLLAGLGYNDYSKIKNHVVALPAAPGSTEKKASKYNINTLDAKLIEAILPNSSVDKIETIVLGQREGGYSSVTKWINSSMGADLAPVESLLSVESEFFEIIVNVQFAGRISSIRSHLYRNSENGEIQILKRQQQVLE